MSVLRSLLAAVFIVAAAAAPARAQIDARMLRHPDVSATQITFVYGGDVWVAPKEGGLAQRLSSPAGEESFPRFSPDGSRIAFTGAYDGNSDIYVVPALGGLPTRVTHHPAPDRMLDWYPDGSGILFASFMTSEKDRFFKLFRTGATGGLPEQLPMPYGEFGSLSPDGRMIAYTPHTRDFRTWKRYRGGLADKIWIFDLERREARRIPTTDANDTQPMWHGTTVYFLSDRGENQRYNLWAYDTRTEQVRQLTNFADYDVRFPSIGPSEIVFENGGRLHLFDLASEQTRAVDIQVVTDRASLRPRVARVGNAIAGFDVSPTGVRAVFEARGEVFTAPAEDGIIRNLSQSSGSAERTPTWSPDGRTIAWWSDASGEYELVLAPADGGGAIRTITHLGPGFRYRPFWSPDAKRIAYIDVAMQIHILNVEDGRDQVIDKANYYTHGALANWRPSWSADSRWLAYDRDLESATTAVFLHDTRSGRSHQVTSGFYPAGTPVFDPEGKYLYFLTGRSFNPVYSDFDGTWVYNNSTVIAALPLRADVPSPLVPLNDEEPVRGDSAAAKPANGAASSAVEIDLDEMERRLVILPPAPGNYGELQAAPGKVLYHRHVRTGAGQGQNPIVYWDLKERKEETVLDDAATFLVTANAKKMLVRQGQRFAVIDILPARKIDKTIDLVGMEMTVDPMAEWKQLFADAWRLERDMFYDPGMHGVDWNGLRTHYGRLLEQSNTREDVNFVIGELIGELSASHTYRSGGDLEQPPQRPAGLLGADYVLDNGAYRIARIVRAADWDTEVRSPLAEPGAGVAEGDYLLAINGVRLVPGVDPWAALQGLSGKAVSITVNDRPTDAGARTLIVKTLTPDQDYRLRNLAWIESNRRRVDEATGGRVGYIFVPSTGVDGQTELFRQFAGQWMKDGLIIDERFNNGGQIPDRFVELLARKRTNYWAVRDGMDWPWPFGAHEGAKVMLINEWSGSGGDAFPYYFRQAGVGPLVGKRTWGGLIGISGAPPLIDGGSVTVPSFGFYTLDGQWQIEGHGVEPDIEVEADPGEMAKGRDPQLERAIEEAMRLLRESPPLRAQRPVHPTRVPGKAADGTGGH